MWNVSESAFLAALDIASFSMLERMLSASLQVSCCIFVRNLAFLKSWKMDFDGAGVRSCPCTVSDGGSSSSDCSTCAGVSLSPCTLFSVNPELAYTLWHEGLVLFPKMFLGGLAKDELFGLLPADLVGRRSWTFSILWFEGPTRMKNFISFSYSFALSE